MASSQTASRPIQKILDSTKVATLSKFIRRPPIDPETPIQGRPRQPGSNAYKEHQAREGRRLQKALDAIAHGKHIFAYHNVRTNQVVYSLTRYLEKNNLLRQMIYHGKKTVPAEIRRDMWVPYYSVHFGDSRLGLRAYQLLREFSKQRQLAPPPEMITVTEAFLAQKRPRDPVGAEEFDKINMKRIGCTMEKKERARVLMDQKATSVADIAAVLGIQKQEIENGFLDKERKPGHLTRKALRRRRDARDSQAAKAEENAARVASLEEHLSKRSKEEVNIVDNDGDYPDLAEEVKILWRDMHDAHHAESWPESVEHGELELKRSTIIGKEVVQDVDIIADSEFKEREVPQERV
ncbi:hypothetical protein N7492_010494 [Penicillium capsulatum]|uniref:Large ribosomal subunit protein mL67 n=1 Tax=Penicillium capsulatum TaxID=69766 RepID=A0A9W9LEZ4_9EURO|nr:hypothetical protein N7492_010494 [Penicillium capsulatum]KAJ6112996.1 hypothetical protein N7512_008320 [Penicillium capsulatum]